LQAYFSLATDHVFGNKIIEAMAAKYQKTVSQICLRYVLQKDVNPLPKSTHEQYIIENAQLDFDISVEDMYYLDSLENII